MRQSVSKSLILLSLLTMLLSGCATGNFENRLALTLGGDELLIVSKYGFFGVATEISKKDLDAIKSFQKPVEEKK